MPCVSFLAFPFVARFLCGGRKGTFAYRVGLLSILALALGCAAGFLYLFDAGRRAGWTSDGPGMLIVVLVMLGLAALSLVFGAMFIHALSREDAEAEDRLAPVRVALAWLVVVSVVASLAALGWRYSRG